MGCRRHRDKDEKYQSSTVFPAMAAKQRLGLDFLQGEYALFEESRIEEMAYNQGQQRQDSATQNARCPIQGADVAGGEEKGLVENAAPGRQPIAGVSPDDAQQKKTKAEGELCEAENAVFPLAHCDAVQRFIREGEPGAVPKDDLKHDAQEHECCAQPEAQGALVKAFRGCNRGEEPQERGGCGEQGTAFILRERLFEDPLPLLFRLGGGVGTGFCFGSVGTGAAQKLVAGDTEDFRDYRDECEIRCTFVALPTAHGLV